VAIRQAPDYSLWQSGKLQHDSEKKENSMAKYVHETLGWEEATEDFTLAQEQKQKRTAELASAKREYVLTKGKMRYHEDRLRGLDTLVVLRLLIELAIANV
jgi:hypothetical protein